MGSLAYKVTADFSALLTLANTLDKGAEVIGVDEWRHCLEQLCAKTAALKDSLDNLTSSYGELPPGQAQGQ